jgi:hypothetical protein
MTMNRDHAVLMAKEIVPDGMDANLQSGLQCFSGKLSEITIHNLRLVMASAILSACTEEAKETYLAKAVIAEGDEIMECGHPRWNSISGDDPSPTGCEVCDAIAVACELERERCAEIVNKEGNEAWPFPAAKIVEIIRSLK